MSQPFVLNTTLDEHFKVLMYLKYPIDHGLILKFVGLHMFILSGTWEHQKYLEITRSKSNISLTN